MTKVTLLRSLKILPEWYTFQVESGPFFNLLYTLVSPPKKLFEDMDKYIEATQDLRLVL